MFEDDESLQAYNRRKEDSLAVDVALLKEQLQDVIQTQREAGLLLAQLLRAEAEHKAKADFINKILAPIGTLVLTLLGAFLGYIVPAYMSKH
jgi:hypothetical protein